jgi:predicted SAM-dependent methyltransferase
MKIIVGAGGTRFYGWVSLEERELDITDQSQWAKRFEPATLEAILAEHVFEHLTLEEGYAAALNCFEYLRPGGYLRVAVPDGLHPSPNYIAWVRPVTGWNGDDHKVLYDYRRLARLLMQAGFDVNFLECWDEDGKFRVNDWSHIDGYISRCCGGLWSNFFLSPIVGAPYTSLILDAVKR